MVDNNAFRFYCGQLASGRAWHPADTSDRRPRTASSQAWHPADTSDPLPAPHPVRRGTQQTLAIRAPAPLLFHFKCFSRTCSFPCPARCLVCVQPAASQRYIVGPGAPAPLAVIHFPLVPRPGPEWTGAR